MTQKREDLGWQVVIHPEDAQLHIETPKDTERGNVAFVQYFGNQAWSMIRGLDKYHTVSWRGKTYWAVGDRNSLQLKMGDWDNIWIDPETDGPPQPIEWSVLTSFQDLGSGPTNKRVQYIRPNFIADSVPGYSVIARYNYDIKELSTTPTGDLHSPGHWDIANWDEDIWGGNLEVIDLPKGSFGIGRHVAVAMRGKSSSRTILVAFDLLVDVGGLM
jgi:hypothetical protein